MDKTKLLELVKRMPKVEMHVHIEGTMSPATLREIAQANDYYRELPPDKVAEIQQERFTYTDFFHFIDTYSLCANALRKSADYERVTYEYLRAAHAENIRYVEAFVSPYNRMQLGLPFADIVDGIGRGRSRALAELGIRANFVVDVGRHLLWTPQKNPQQAAAECRRLVELAAGARDKGVVGFSVGGKEAGYPVYPFAAAFEMARQAGLRTKAHTGEGINSDDVWYVLGLLKVDRISNAVHAIEDSGLVDYLIAHNVAVELCPVGNVLTGAAASLDRHPVKDYLRRGVPVAIGSDDPALFNTTLTHEYEVLVTEMGFTADELEQMALNSVDLSWLADADKAALRATFAGELRQLRAELGV